MRNVFVTTEPVELYKILKFEGLADNGGEAKAVIEQGLVSVNGEIETRKRRQIVSGDTIEFATQTLRIVRGETASTPPLKKEKAPSPTKRPKFSARNSR
jgi:ribosome-associated protein